MTLAQAYKHFDPKDHEILVVRKGFGVGGSDTYACIRPIHLPTYKKSGWEECVKPAAVPKGAKKSKVKTNEV